MEVNGMVRKQLETYYSIPELAEKLSVTKSFLWKKVHNHEITVYRINGMIRIPESAIKELLVKEC